MEKEQTAIIKKIIAELISKTGFTSEVEVIKKENDDNDRENFICNVQINEDPQVLIGQYGFNLQALQHIARLLVRKKVDKKARFILDINSYRQQKNESIINQARQAASEAILEGRAIVMRPMSAYERRLVHMELSTNPEVETESVGDKENRKVIVRPAKNITIDKK